MSLKYNKYHVKKRISKKEVIKIAEKIEQQLENLLEKCLPFLSKETIEEVKEKTLHKEYAIALEVLGYDFISKKIMIPGDASIIFSELTKKMGMQEENDDDHWFWLKLSPFLTFD